MSLDRGKQEPKRRRRGQRKPLTGEQRRLAEQYVPLARKVSKPFRKRYPSLWEEFDSAALLALVEAAESFDVGRGVKFATFAYPRIVGALRDVLRRASRDGRPLDNAESHASVETGHSRRAVPVEIVNTTPDADVGTDQAEVDAVERWLRKLPRTHAQACREIYVNGCSQVEAARRLGLSQSRLSYMHREAIAMLNGTWYREANNS